MKGTKIFATTFVLAFFWLYPVRQHEGRSEANRWDIVVAADSLWSRADGQSEVPRTLGCKIANIGRMYFTASTSDIDAVLLESLAKEAMSTSVTLAEAAHKLSLKRDMLAKHTAEYFSQNSIDRVWNNGKGAADVIFFGIEHGEPKLILINFLQRGHSRINLKSNTKEQHCPVECVNNRPIVLGSHEHIDKTIKKNPHIVTGATQAALRELVKLEEEAVSDSVAGPIDVLTLDENGPRWEPSEGRMCSPEETKAPTKTATRSPDAQRSPGGEHPALFSVDERRSRGILTRRRVECGSPFRSKQRKLVLA